MARKTDNSNLAAKIKLRRYFLRKYHADRPPDVLDCCQGEGILWEQLQQEFAVRTYWGVDVKARKGRLKLNSVRILEQAGWPQNVIDVDTYGSPWKHWEAIVANVIQPTTVFLTIGQWQMGTDRVILQSLGMGGLAIPPGIARKLHKMAVSWLLTMGYDYNTIGEAIEVIPSRSSTTRYIGVRLEPKANGRRAGTLGRSGQTQPVKEAEYA